MTERLLTVNEVADRLNCSSNQVRALIRVEKLHAVNLAVNGRRHQFRVSQAELDRFIKNPTEAGEEVARLR